ncbi:acyltransferase family protein [Acinetobacter sp. Ver3]|uniref:acyltransferase family protein n=1 Tax=Acinetobacter sp. Ver3 TaxID=466088 RepID=UPI00045382B1|nr:acyltransferase [Acinetobacter sp. Ver3]EZQ12067.1 lipopolysaccharide modification acyltransferase [Acinetobacter sp. Ver3]
MQYYRSDIDGLRALAVFGVILFHAGTPFITGGFLGVDVFLVISGFLITRILIDNAENNKFSFLDFYSRRFRRIYPALLTMITIVSVINLFIMIPYDLKNYGQSIVASILSANNILLYLTSGYWSTAAEFKPLYHTWTLAVEEQYYIVIPFLIYFIHKIKPKNTNSLLFYTLSLLFIASFSFCYIYQDNREFTFLMLFSRAWELLAGAIAAIIYKKTNINNNYLSTLGFILIVFSYFYVDKNSFHPGLVTLLPVIGTTLIVLFNRNTNNFLFKLLSIKPIVLMGLISYSLYLWHQPVFAGIRLLSQEQPQTLYFLMAILPIILISYFSWKFIEKPFRNTAVIAEKKSITILTIWSIVLIGYGATLHLTYGLHNYYGKFSYEGDPRSFVDDAYKYQYTQSKNILVLGDSFGRDLIRSLNQVNVKDIKYFPIGCDDPSVFTKPGELNDYLKEAKIVTIALLLADPDRDYKEQLTQLNNCFKVVNQINPNTYILGTKNFGYNNNFVRISNKEFSEIYVSPIQTYLEFDKLAKQDFGDRYISIFDKISNKESKVPVFYKDNFISYDTKHLTPAGAKFIAQEVLLDSPLKSHLK